ncbi:MAG: sigma factor-like helix-turn-helix DNA-binding protein [Nitrososphaeria archaeon]
MLGLKHRRARSPIEVNSIINPTLRTIVEYYNSGMPVKKIAEKLGYSVNTIEAYLYKARHPEKVREGNLKRLEKFWQKNFEKRFKPSLTFNIPGTGRKSECRIWLLDLFANKNLQNRKIYFNTPEERINFLTQLFRGQNIEGRRKAILTMWLKDNFLKPEEIEKFYSSITIIK